MKLLVNERALKRGDRIGLAYLAGATLCLVGGFFLSYGLPDLETKRAKLGHRLHHQGVRLEREEP